MRRVMRFRLFLTIFALLLTVSTAAAYDLRNRWTTTASGSTGSIGDPITLTWSIVPDGTAITGQGDSDLVEFLDGIFNYTPPDPGNLDLQQHPWFQYFDASFNRWSQISGITYVYEENDDGKRQGSFWSGSLSTRGDVRIGGDNIDGAGGTLAFDYFPNNSDMTIDTADSAFYSNSANSYLSMRNVIMHEAGHGLGFNHIESNNASFLLEPFISTSFDGPQFDDILAAHAYYGDVFEKGNNGLGNDTAALAINIGSLSVGSSLSIGTDATSTFVDSTDIDFVSIDRNTDTDYFSITVDSPVLLDVVLTPLGPTYNQIPEGGSQSVFNSAAQSDLALAIFDTDMTTPLGIADVTGLGQAEMLSSIDLSESGEYYVRIMGSSTLAQFYQLDLSAKSAISFQEADFDLDGDVDSNDFGTWESAFGLNAGGDTDDDLDTDGIDFLTWQSQFDGGSSQAAVAFVIPEPQAWCLMLLAGLVLLARRV